MVQMNLFPGQEKRHICREWTCGHGVGGDGMSWECVFTCIHYHMWNRWKWKQKPLSYVRLFATPWTNTVHGILQDRTLEWVAIPFSGGSSQPRGWTQVSCIAGGFFTSWATGEPKVQLKNNKCLLLVDCHKGTKMIWSLLSMIDKHREGHGGDLLPLQASSYHLHGTKWKLYNKGSVMTPQFVFFHTVTFWPVRVHVSSE